MTRPPSNSEEAGIKDELPIAEPASVLPVDDLVEGAIEVRDESVLPSAQKGHFPWHAPRKHWCRIHQWCVPVERLIKELGIASHAKARAFRYMSLPGDELLDVRTLHGVFERTGVKLQFLGYNTANSSPRADEADISFSEVRSLPNVSGTASRVVNERLERVSDAASLAHRAFAEHVPFDAINLDLCNSALVDPPLAPDGLLRALRQILEAQFNRRAEPWLLFLTTRVGRATVHAETMRALFHLLEKNMGDASFLDEFTGAFSIGLQDLSAELEGDEAISETVLCRTLGYAICKWVGSISASVQRPWVVTAESSAYYSLADQVPDMYSVALRFAPSEMQGTDQARLTEDRPSASDPVDEVTVARGFIAPVAGSIDVDALLREDVDLYKRTLQQSTNILTSARHDRQAYLAWVSEFNARFG